MRTKYTSAKQSTYSQYDKRGKPNTNVQMDRNRKKRFKQRQTNDRY